MLSNAVKFVPVGSGQIIVGARTYYWNNPVAQFGRNYFNSPKLYVEIEVKDNGPGISKKD